MVRSNIYYITSIYITRQVFYGQVISQRLRFKLEVKKMIHILSLLI